MRKIISVSLALMLMLCSFAACGKDNGQGKSYTYPIDNDPVYLDPQIAVDSGASSIITNCFEGLVRLGARGEIIPGVAKSWTVSDDGRVYMFILREDAQWFITKAAKETVGEENLDSFDTRVKAGDFVFALRRAVEKETNAAGADRLLCIKNAEKIHSGKMSSKNLGVTAQGDYAVKIELEYPDDDFLLTLTKPVCMPCNERFFEMTNGRYGLLTKYLIYNGPFYISVWYENTSLTIRKNESYFGENVSTASSVVFSVNNEYSTRGKKLSQGIYDETPLTLEQYESYRNEKKLSFTEKENILWALVFNCNDEVMKNVNARLGVCYGFDKAHMEQGRQMTKAANGVIPSCLYMNMKPYREYASVVRLLSPSEKKAESFWNKALSDMDKGSISITISCTSQQESQIRGVIQNLQKTFGISCDARVSVFEEDELKQKVDSGNYQIAYLPIKAESDFATDFIEKTVPSLTRYSSKEFTSLISRIRKASPEEKIKGVAVAEEHLVNNGVILPVYEAVSYYGTAEKVSGIYLDISGSTVSFYQALKVE